MAKIQRSISDAQGDVYDMIIVGGGIHGIMTALEAGRRNLKILLLEKADFGGATSYNSLRIIHGGFRYLQRLDIQRMIESAHERRWFQTCFAPLVKPLPCLFPLYGKGLRRPLLFGPALALYNALTYDRNRGLAPEQAIPEAGLIDTRRTLELFPGLVAQGLKGGGVWYDAFMPDSQRILIGCLRWAASLGVRALNYVRATSLITHGGKVAGLRAVDEESGDDLEFRSKTVVNVAGPWCREVATRFHKDTPSLFKSMLAFNVLFNRPPVSSFAAAITNGDPTAHTFFSVPWKGKLFVGTGQVPWLGKDTEPKVSEQQLQAFCKGLQQALPQMTFKLEDIVNVYAGLQSATHTGGTEFSNRSTIVDHAANGGPEGLFSVSGIKFTTARSVAEKALSRIVATGRKMLPATALPPQDATVSSGVYPYEWHPDAHDTAWRTELARIIADESVLHLDDLVLRRTSIGDNPKRALMLADAVCGLFGWGAERQEEERRRLERHFDAACVLFAGRHGRAVVPADVAGQA